MRRCLFISFFCFFVFHLFYLFVYALFVIQLSIYSFLYLFIQSFILYIFFFVYLLCFSSLSKLSSHFSEEILSFLLFLHISVAICYFLITDFIYLFIYLFSYHLQASRAHALDLLVLVKFRLPKIKTKNGYMHCLWNPLFI